MKSGCLGLLAMGLLAIPVGAQAGSISYSLAAVDFGAPSTFGFSFSAPIAPVAGLADFSFSGSFTLTDATGDGVSISNSGSLPEYWRLSVGNPLTIVDNVGGASSLVGVGPHSFAASGSFDCASIGGCTVLQIEVWFTGSGGGDGIQSSGTFSLDPASVPEPGTLVLLGLGLVGLGMTRRRNAA
jgi:PEP-CTERM motif